MTKTMQAIQYQVLDPCLLGRPVHLLHLFAAQLRDDLGVAMRLPACRRYWGAFQVDSVAFSRLDGESGGGRWLSFAGAHGQIGFSLERAILFSVMNHRYGRAGSPVAGSAGAGSAGAGSAGAGATSLGTAAAGVRVTATEERLAVALGQQFVAILLARVRANLAALGKAAADPPVEPKPRPGLPPAKGGWIVSVALSDADTGDSGRCWFSLDKAGMAEVLRGLLPERERARQALKSVRPLASRLLVRLEGRLLSKQVALGALLELRVGDVIPISLSRTDVLLEESRLFTAAVSEFRGKLCLTAFEDVE